MFFGVLFLTFSTLAPKGAQRGYRGCPSEPKVTKKLPTWIPKVIKMQQKCRQMYPKLREQLHNKTPNKANKHIEKVLKWSPKGIQVYEK